MSNNPWERIKAQAMAPPGVDPGEWADIVEDTRRVNEPLIRSGDIHGVITPHDMVKIWVAPDTHEALQKLNEMGLNPRQRKALENFLQAQNSVESDSSELRELLDSHTMPPQKETGPTPTQLTPSAGVTPSGRKYKIDMKRSPNPQSPTGFSWSINQVFE